MPDGYRIVSANVGFAIGIPFTNWGIGGVHKSLFIVDPSGQVVARLDGIAFER